MLEFIMSSLKGHQGALPILLRVRLVGKISEIWYSRLVIVKGVGFLLDDVGRQQSFSMGKLTSFSQVERVYKEHGFING